ncbi:hypothetical protein ACI6PS_07960 [Flavobacterium sp. PLA-1-15]|uniref:hypothetical protein n=1 Tax=Flavobacterium sp. PLA-1-15 TaxID=3380533 RepID=UPI003B7E9425
MALLRKIRSATLMEALIATVLIVIVFVIASLVLNTILLNTFVKNTHKISYRMNELEYAIQNHKLDLPYVEQFEGWDISIEKNNTVKTVIILAFDQEERKILRKRIYAE